MHPAERSFPSYQLYNLYTPQKPWRPAFFFVPDFPWAHGRGRVGSAKPACASACVLRSSWPRGFVDLCRALRRMAGLVFLLVFWALAGGACQRHGVGVFFIVQFFFFFFFFLASLIWARPQSNFLRKVRPGSEMASQNGQMRPNP